MCIDPVCLYNTVAVVCESREFRAWCVLLRMLIHENQAQYILGQNGTAIYVLGIPCIYYYDDHDYFVVYYLFFLL